MNCFGGLPTTDLARSVGTSVPVSLRNEMIKRREQFFLKTSSRQHRSLSVLLFLASPTHLEPIWRNIHLRRIHVE